VVEEKIADAKSQVKEYVRCNALCIDHLWCLNTGDGSAHAALGGHRGHTRRAGKRGGLGPLTT